MKTDRTSPQTAGVRALERIDRAHFFVAKSFDQPEFVTASVSSQRQAPHAHETFVIGGISGGYGTQFIRGSQRLAGTGDLTLYNPGEIHDCAPGCEAGFDYRVSYPSIDMMKRVAKEVSRDSRIGTPFFKAPIIRDPNGLAAFTVAHRTIELDRDTLAGDERLIEVYAGFLIRHAEIKPASVGREQRPIERVKVMIADRCTEDISLAELAAEAGLSRFHLIRVFQRATGQTPHAYLINRRVEHAKLRLRAGEKLSAVAVAAGFSDQAHLTRVFKARVGVTPGVYRAAVAS